MAYTETELIARVSTVLQDPSTATYSTAVIRSVLDQSLRELSDYSPQIAKATVTFASTVPELSIAALTDLIDLECNGEQGVEYGIDKNPKKWRNFQMRGGSVIVDIDFAPSAGDTAYVWYAAPHTVSGTATNTLDIEEERLLIDLTAGHIVSDYALSRINKVNTGSARAWADFRVWGQEKIAEARRELRRISKPNISIRYPRVS